MRTGIIFTGLFLSLGLSLAQAQTVAPLRVGDVFDLRLAGVPQEYAGDFTLQCTIDQGGTVNLPLLGEIKAAGLRPAQLERAIEAGLVAGKIFSHPAVLVNVAANGRHVSISGGVRMPQRLQ